MTPKLAEYWKQERQVDSTQGRPALEGKVGTSQASSSDSSGFYTEKL